MASHNGGATAPYLPSGARPQPYFPESRRIATMQQAARDTPVVDRTRVRLVLRSEPSPQGPTAYSRNVVPTPSPSTLPAPAPAPTPQGQTYTMLPPPHPTTLPPPPPSPPHSSASSVEFNPWASMMDDVTSWPRGLDARWRLLRHRHGEDLESTVPPSTMNGDVADMDDVLDEPDWEPVEADDDAASVAPSHIPADVDTSIAPAAKWWIIMSERKLIGPMHWLPDGERPSKQDEKNTCCLQLPRT